MSMIPRTAFDSWYEKNASPDHRETAFAAANWGQAYDEAPNPDLSPRKRLAIFVAGTLFARPSLSRWLTEVRREGVWAPFVFVRPETVSIVDNPFRSEEVRACMALVEGLSPDAVLVVGNVARIAAGFESADGHSARCEWTHLHLSGHVRFDELTDSRNYGGSAWMGNMAGDGRFDLLNPGLRRRRWPVYTIDFSEPIVREGQTYLGVPVWPKRDPLALLDAYFDRNVAYRSGKLPPLPRMVYLHGGDHLWPKAIRDEIAATATAEGLAADIDQPGARRLNREALFAFWGTEPYLWPADGDRARALALVQYKSYGATRLAPGASCHYFTERHALVSVWGQHWRPAGGGTIHDWATATLMGRPVRFYDSVYGDPTLSI